MILRYWAFVGLTLILTAVIGYGTYQTGRFLRTWHPPYNILLTRDDNVVRILLIALCIGLGLLSGLPFEQLGWTTAGVGTQIGWGMVWGALLAMLFYTTTRLLLAYTGQRFYSSVIIEHILPRNRRELFLVSIVMGSVVLVEELLFRSLLIGGMTPLMTDWLLVLCVGLIFGVMHAPQGVWGVIGATLAGILFGLLFLQAGSLIMPVVAHYLANMFQIGQAMRLKTDQAAELPSANSESNGRS